MRIQQLVKLHKLQQAQQGEGGDGGSGSGSDEAALAKAAADKLAADAAAASAAGNKPSDAEAKLIKDVMKQKGRVAELEKQAAELADKLKAVEGIDLDKAKKILADQEELERKRAIEQGDFERLTKQMATEHIKEKTALEKQLSERDAVTTSLQRQIADMTVGTSFTSSKFVLEDLTLTPTKARVIYGSHFEFKDGAVVGYDKPVGASDRTMLVGSTGDALSFEDALRKIVDADPDKDHLIRSKQKPGAGSTSNPKAGKKAEQDVKPLTSVERIAAGLKTLAK